MAEVERLNIRSSHHASAETDINARSVLKKGFARLRELIRWGTCGDRMVCRDVSDKFATG